MAAAAALEAIFVDDAAAWLVQAALDQALALVEAAGAGARATAGQVRMLAPLPFLE